MIELKLTLVHVIIEARHKLTLKRWKFLFKFTSPRPRSAKVSPSDLFDITTIILIPDNRQLHKVNRIMLLESLVSFNCEFLRRPFVIRS